MKKFIPQSLIVACCILFSCDNSTQVEENPVVPREVKPQSEVMDRGNAFAFSIFKECYKNKPGQNTFVSPMSISLALGMTANGAVGETQKEMHTLLGLEGKSVAEINSAYEKTIASLTAADTTATLNIANSIWFPTGYSVKPSFINQNIKSFGAEIYEKDFSTNEIVDTVNDWVSEKTKGKIPTVLEKLFWNPRTRMLLINTLYFKGDWSYPFDSTLTKEEAFYKSSNEQAMCKMMHNEASLRYYYENDDYQMVELDYKGRNYAMNIFMPKSGDIDGFTERFDAQEWYNGTSFAKKCIVDLKLPRFKVQSDFELKSIFQSMGVPLPFSPLQADFSAITEAEQLYIGKALHKTYINADEIGTEAAGVTVMEGESMGPKVKPVYENKTMHVNKPFLFTIRHNETKTILFVGMVNSPE